MSTRGSKRGAGGGPALPSQGGEVLLGAAKNDDPHMIKILVRAGVDAGWANRMGQTSLHIAALWGNVKAVKALIELKAPLDAVNRLSGATPLHLVSMGRADKAKKLEVARLLVAAGADKDKEDGHGAKPWFYADDEELRLAMGGPEFKIHKAMGQRDMKALKNLLKNLEYPDQVNESDTDGNTPLHVASVVPWPEAVKVLLHEGADPDDANSDGATPLHIAVSILDVEIADMLLRANASVNKKSLMIDEYHSQQSDWVVIDGLEAQKKGVKFSLSSRGRKDLEKRAVTAEHETALHIAVQRNSLEMVQLLLNHGASIDVADIEEKTPLHLALENLLDDHSPASEAMVSMLLAQGSDPKRGNKDIGRYRTTLHWMVMEGHLPAIDLLIKYGHKALIDRKDQAGFTALMLAARAGKINCMRSLLRNGADTSFVNDQGMDARRLAEVNGKEEAVRVLDEFMQ